MRANKEKRLRLVKPSPEPGVAPGLALRRSTRDVTAMDRTLDQALTGTRAPGNDARLQPTLDRLRLAEREIATLQNELKQLRDLVHVDPLTGTLNRGGLDHSFAREAARADRNNSPLCIALLDIDDFKLLNDRHGHLAGDRALVHLAQTIRQALRPSDVVVRFGGEEFLFLLPDATAEHATQALQRLQHQLWRQPLIYRKQKLRLSFSAGVVGRSPGKGLYAVIGHADRALYQAKRAGKRRVVTAPPGAAGRDLRPLSWDDKRRVMGS